MVGGFDFIVRGFYYLREVTSSDKIPLWLLYCSLCDFCNQLASVIPNSIGITLYNGTFCNFLRKIFKKNENF